MNSKTKTVVTVIAYHSAALLSSETMAFAPYVKGLLQKSFQKTIATKSTCELLDSQVDFCVYLLLFCKTTAVSQ